MFAIVENGLVRQYPFTESDLRNKHPNVSFPEVIDDATMAAFGAQKVCQTERPPFDPDTQVLFESLPVFDEPSQEWRQVWAVRDFTEAEKDNQSYVVRNHRNQRLSETDWTQCKDIPDSVSSAWVAYRQALRDITKQPGFPLKVDWPVSP